MLLYLPLALTAAAFALHLLGERIAVIVTGRPRSRAARTRALMFYAGLSVVFLALGAPIDSLAQRLFWVHMIQHVLLLTVAPPLIVMGAPWMSIWRPLPLNFRRSLARTVVRSPRLAPLRDVCRWLYSPVGAWLAFSVNLIGWHVPAVYDLALQSAAVHALEHVLYLTTESCCGPRCSTLRPCVHTSRSRNAPTTCSVRWSSGGCCRWCSCSRPRRCIPSTRTSQTGREGSRR